MQSPAAVFRWRLVFILWPSYFISAPPSHPALAPRRLPRHPAPDTAQKNSIRPRIGPDLLAAWLHPGGSLAAGGWQGFGSLFKHYASARFRPKIRFGPVLSCKCFIYKHLQRLSGIFNDLPCVAASICAARPALQLSARGIGFFPGTHQPRVIWVGVRDGLGQLSELHRLIDDGLRWLAPAERPEKFTGHITLGRFKPGHHAAIPKLLELAAGYRDQHFGDWQAQAVELVRSELTSTGAEHTVMRAFRLAG